MLRRGIAAGGSVLLAAAVNVTTGMLTQHWAVAWWTATAVLVVVGAGLQIWLTLAGSSTPTPVRASGDSAIAAAGSVARVSTRVTRSTERPGGAPQAVGDGVTASGLGAIAAGGDIVDAHTTVSGRQPQGPDGR
jgi:hypothetical protein